MYSQNVLHESTQSSFIHPGPQIGSTQKFISKKTEQLWPMSTLGCHLS